MAYTITGEKCGTVRLDAEKTGVVVTESVQRSSKVTSNPVEKGSDINDHVINDPVVFSITGVFLDEDQSDILERMWKEKDVVEYTGRTRISDCVITSFKSDISADNKNGSRFTVSLKVINRVSAEYVESGEQMMSAQDANASKKVSKSQTKSTTADGLHTTVSQTISSSAYCRRCGCRERMRNRGWSGEILLQGSPRRRHFHLHHSVWQGRGWRE